MPLITSKRLDSVLQDVKYSIDLRNPNSPQKLKDRKVINEFLGKLKRKRGNVATNYRNLISQLEEDFNTAYGYRVVYNWEK